MLSGAITVFDLFEVAQAIDLQAIRGRFGASATVASLADKTPGSTRLHYIEPPVIIDGAAFGIGEIDGFRVRLKVYEYGVFSLSRTRRFTGDWAELVAIGQDLAENKTLAAQAERECRRIAGDLGPVISGVLTRWLAEDYVVFRIAEPGEWIDADVLIDQHGAEIAQLLRGERQTLSRQERDETLRSRLSYLSTDLVIASWGAAFVYDTEEAAAGALEIVEFANSQLLEFRFHDEQLEHELGGIYADLQRRRWTDTIVGRRYRRAIARLHSLFIDVNELTDRTENALKFAGDEYSARLFTLTGSRLGLDDWKRNVQDKLKTLDDIYRFAVEETRVSQGNVLELIIVIILVFELFLSLTGLFGY